LAEPEFRPEACWLFENKSKEKSEFSVTVPATYDSGFYAVCYICKRAEYS